MKQMNHFWITFSILLWVFNCTLTAHESDGRLNGDVNCDGNLDVTDPIIILTHIFLGGSPPCHLPDPPELIEEIESLMLQVSQLEGQVEDERSQKVQLGSDLNNANQQILTLQTQLEELQNELIAVKDERDAALQLVSQFEVPGCMDPDAQNFDSCANIDNGSCQYPGCTDPEAINYDEDANFDDGTCRYPNDLPSRIRMYRIVALPSEYELNTANATGINNFNMVSGKNSVPVTWGTDREINLLEINESFPLNHNVFGINNNGVSFGQYWDSDGVNHHVTWSLSGEMTHLTSITNLVGVQATGINDAGLVIGYGHDGHGGDARGFLWDLNGEVLYVTIPFPYTSGTPIEINKSGKIIGGLSAPGIPGAGVVWPSIIEDPIPMPLPDGLFQTQTNVVDLNEDGYVVGEIYTQPQNIPVIWNTNTGEISQELADFDSRFIPVKINNLNQVFGYGPRGDESYLYANGVFAPMHELIVNKEEWPSWRVIDINDNGVMTGNGNNVGSNGSHKAILFIPTDSFYQGN